MREARLTLKVEGAEEQNLGVFHVASRPAGPNGGVVVSIPEIMRGLAVAFQNQADGLRDGGLDEDLVNDLLIELWPFKKERHE